MKINFILPGIHLSGGVRIVFMYAEFLSRQGHDVVCYYPISGAYTGWKKFVSPLYNLCRWFCSDNTHGKWFEEDICIKHPMWINNVTVRKADIVIATSWLTSYWVKRLSPKKGKKVYFIQEYETWGTPKQNKKTIESYHIPMDLSITVSTALKERLKEENNKESVLISNGIPKTEINTTERCENKGIPTIGFPFRTGIRKNCSFAIHVLQRVQNERKCNVIAYGMEYPDSWPENWKFLYNPSREQLNDFYNETDIFYVPSLYEGWGLPAMEAMAHGCAVVAHDSGVIHEMGKNHENCVILENAADEDKTETLLVSLLDDMHKVRRIGENARKIIINQYTQEEACKKFEAAIENIVT